MQLRASDLSQVKMLVLDVDGVMTDTRVFWAPTGPDQGQWVRFFSIRDGAGIKRLQVAGYKIAIITGSTSEDIRQRAKSLKIDFFFEGALDKQPAFEKLQNDSGLKPTEMAYMGDDYFDVPILKEVAFAATVPDAMEEALEICDYITKRPAGAGAVREVCDLIFKYGAFSRGETR